MAYASALWDMNGSRGGVAADGDLLCDCLPRKYRHRYRRHVALCPCGCTERLFGAVSARLMVCLTALFESGVRM